MTDKLRSYGVAHRELIPEAIHSTQQYENNRAEQSHEPTRVRERGNAKVQISWDRLSVSWARTLQFRTYSILEGTWSGRSITGNSGSVRSVTGVGQLHDIRCRVVLI